MGTDLHRSGAGLSARRRSAPTLAVLVFLTAGGCTAKEAAPPSPEPSYGTLPSFLPSDSVNADSVLAGSAANPALTSQGDAVDVRLSGNAVRATVTGPEVPGQGLPVETPATTCTWKVTLAAPTADLPIAITDFTTRDHLGVVYHPALVPGQPRPPAALAKGKTVTFELRAVMTTGEGLMRWAPGGKTVASWDFEVETD